MTGAARRAALRVFPRFRPGLRTRLSAFYVISLAVVGFGFHVLLVKVTRRELLRELDFRARTLLTQLADQSVLPLLVGDHEQLEAQMRLGARDPDVVEVAIYRPDGTPALGRAPAARAPGAASWLPAPDLPAGAVETHVPDGRNPHWREYAIAVDRRRPSPGTPEEEARELLGLAPDGPGPDRVGWVRVRYSTGRIEGSVASAARLGAIILSLLVGFGVLALAALLRVVVRPLREASDLAGLIASGQLDRRMPVRNDDELGALARSMNQMANSLDEARSRAAAEASALRDGADAVVQIARVARGADDPGVVFEGVARQLQRLTGCGAVALATPAGEDRALRFTRFTPRPWGATAVDWPVAWAPLAEAAGRERPTRLLVAPGAADQVPELRDEGFRAILAVPLVLENDLRALLLLAAAGEEAFPPGQVDMVAALATHLSTALHVERLRERLESAFQELRSTRDYVVRSERLRVAGELASGVAHDFNNVLAAILGRTQMVQRQMTTGGVGTEALVHALQIIERAAQDGRETMRRLRQFGRGPDGLPHEPVDLDVVIRDAVEFTRPRWESEMIGAGVTIEVEVRSSSGTMVRGRVGELREVFTNLLLNAVDAMPGGGIIRVECSAGRDTIRASVVDNGTGMSPEIQAQLFNPFFTTKGERGTGLGMPLVHGIIERHGGTIEVESHVGRGTRITIALPAASVAERADESASPGAADDTAPAALRVLVVDDEEAVRDVLRDMIVMFGHDVTACRAAHEALEIFGPKRFDLVLTDLGMPGMNGWELGAEIRRRDPGVPLAFVTGWGDQVTPEELRAAGADAVVSKPFSIDDVTRLLHRATRRRNEPMAA